MSQSDYNIGNSDGATVRADINSQLDAIGSQNSGSTAPPVTFPYMRWFDTATQQLKERNGANTAWIVTHEIIDGEVVPYSAGESADDRYLAMWRPGTKNVNSIDGSGILEISPEDGRYIALEGHGSANYIIEGFGDQCPVGWVVTLVIPRTIGDTGGTANSLGNYVQFIHATSGAGLDNEKIKILNDGVAFRGYRAYPDRCDSSGFAAALREELTYQHIGAGRWVLREIPRNAFLIRGGSGFIGNLEVTMDAMGRQVIEALRTSASTSGVTLTHTSRFDGELPVMSGAVASNNSRTLVFSLPTVSQVTANRFNSMTGDSVGLDFYYKASGRWKPIV